MSSMHAAAHRILVIDDTPAIHQDFRRILSTAASHVALEALEAALFDKPTSRPPTHHFEVDSAFQGEEGLARVREAAREGRPYAMAFVDVRMPPGMDGVETTVRLWQEDGELQVVLCSAYADYSWEQMVERLGISQRLLILRKPFDNVEVRQLAHSLVEKWELLRRERMRVEELAKSVVARTRELEAANARLRQEAEDRARLEARLAHVRTLEALGQLAAGLAHEVNNPLSFVISNLNHIRKELHALTHGRLSSEQQELLEACEDALMGTERIRRVVQDVKLFATREPLHAGAVDLRTVLEEAITLASHSLVPRIQLVRALEPVPAVWATEHRLIQVFLNLLINAAQALECGTAEPRIHLATGLHEDGRVRVEIQDNGPGIASQHLQHLFEPFFTTKPAGVGTGLGLSICQGIVTGLGGEILVESSPGQGATFRVLLPQAQSARESAPAYSRVSSSA
jgi:two-component system, NtrC family, sensor kinase